MPKPLETQTSLVASIDALGGMLRSAAQFTAREQQQQQGAR